jgi:hypothetical protein
MRNDPRFIAIQVAHRHAELRRLAQVTRLRREAKLRQRQGP